MRSQDSHSQVIWTGSSDTANIYGDFMEYARKHETQCTQDSWTYDKIVDNGKNQNHDYLQIFWKNAVSIQLVYPKKNFATENFEISTQKNTQNGQQQNDPI